MIKSQTNCSDLNEPDLITVTTALQKILAQIKPLQQYQRIGLDQACGRTLYHAVIAPFNVPPHRNSAVDGYAINSTDLPESGDTSELVIAGAAYAGQPFTGALAPGECLRIMTGAPVPEPLNVVIMQEQVERFNNTITLDHTHRRHQNIRQAGEDIVQGCPVLLAGKLLTPADIGLLASLGLTEIDVTRKLRIAIASTGDELHSLGSELAPGGIYDSNCHTLKASLERPDITVVNLGILDDNPASLQRCFEETATHCDLIISTGGVSVGDADHTRTALRALGSIEFWKVAIKPGRPLAFGCLNKTPFFGLPGNPVAVLVTLYQFVLPAIDKMLGITDRPVCPAFTALSTEAIRKRPGRTEIQRGIISQTTTGHWHVKTTGQQGSGILRSMSLANAFIILEHDRGPVKKGDPVTVQPFAGLL
ncbi:MAG: molybdopterin molybdotransferase MoeA [Methylococcales bacterium]|nr:molybdopterin molybdotransferase MoeA [Methylococcales bacterium]